MRNILIVLCVLALLLIVGPKICSESHVTRIDKTKAAVASLESAVKMYKLEKGVFPSSIEDLSEFVNFAPIDAWGNEYILKAIEDNSVMPIVGTYGADAKLGGGGKNADVFSGQL